MTPLFNRDDWLEWPPIYSFGHFDRTWKKGQKTNAENADFLKIFVRFFDQKVINFWKSETTDFHDFGQFLDFSKTSLWPKSQKRVKNPVLLKMAISRNFQNDPNLGTLDLGPRDPGSGSSLVNFSDFCWFFGVFVVFLILCSTYLSMGLSESINRRPLNMRNYRKWSKGVKKGVQGWVSGLLKIFLVFFGIFVPKHPRLSDF